ncbi:hypothetical protein GCM10027081_11210 [Cupriavidus yeoncheonensis]
MGQAGTTMDEIVQAVRRVTDIMGEISAASAEQSSGIEQVNQAVAQMDEVTQQNAALVEQAAAAAGSLQDQAGRLQTVVATFRLAADGTPAAARFEPTPSVRTAVRPSGKARPQPARKLARTGKVAPEAAPVPDAASEPVTQPATTVRAAPRPAALAAADNGDWSAF